MHSPRHKHYQLLPTSLLLQEHDVLTTSMQQRWKAQAWSDHGLNQWAVCFGSVNCCPVPETPALSLRAEVCAGTQVTPQDPDQMGSPCHLPEQWPSPGHQHGLLHGCAPQLSTLRSVLSPRKDPNIQGRMGPVLPSVLTVVAASKKSSSQGRLLPPGSCLPFLRDTDTALNYPSSVLSTLGSCECTVQ